MHSVKVKYVLFQRRWMPLITMKLNSQNSSVLVDGYLDSGAFYSVFQLSLTKTLSLELKYAKKRYLVTAKGGLIPVHIFKLPIELAEHSFIAEIGFSDRLGVGFNIMGRKSIFENFDEIIFREKLREVEFRN